MEQKDQTAPTPGSASDTERTTDSQDNLRGVFDVTQSNRILRYNKSNKLDLRVGFMNQGPLIKNSGQVKHKHNVPIPSLIQQSMEPMSKIVSQKGR